MEDSVNVICYINEFKDRYHISIDPEKALTKKTTFLHDENHEEARNGGNIPQHNEGYL